MNEEERRLLQLLLEQPEKGVADAIQRYGNTVRWIIVKLLGSANSSEIEECMADVFVRLWQGAAQFDTDRGTKLSSWVYAIARHTALDYRRCQQRREISIPLEEADLQIELNLEDRMARNINGIILRQTVDALPPPDREIFIYRYFCEMSVREIAERVSLTVKQVENKLYRGKLSLRTQLLERGIIR